MYLVKSTKVYEKSYNKLKKSGLKDRKVLDEIDRVVDIIAGGGILDRVYRDHKLEGDYFGYRECHIRPDLLLIYQIQKDRLVLVLLDIGSHSQLFR